MEDDEEKLIFYGTPLEPLEEDEVPSKKPVAIEDQIVTDENGKRRFHGAFTGGFSAGFWNTVGSQEGWTPSSFKSSRAEKAGPQKQQKPEDFMDDEDLGDFGIAPQKIEAKSDFQIETKGSSHSRKRKLAQPGLGPIPGVPILQQLLKPVEDKIAVRILRSMGWKPGQGIGPRQTRKEKKAAQKRNARELYIMERYGCSFNEAVSKKKADECEDDSEVNENAVSDNNVPDDDDDDDDDDDFEDNEITFAPDDYEPMLCIPKTNRFGIGYSGLNRDPVLSSGSSSASKTTHEHFNLFGPLELLDKNNKRLSIRGQAFGVGALEEEDEDIYARDDFTKYDFALGGTKPKQQKPQDHVQSKYVLEGFVEAEVVSEPPQRFIVELPHNFKPRNWLLRKSRFEPLDEKRAQQLNINAEYKRRGLGRHDLNPEQREAIWDNSASKREAKKEPDREHVVSTDSTSATRRNEDSAHDRREAKRKDLLKLISSKGNAFTTGGIITKEGEEMPAKDDLEASEADAQRVLLAKVKEKTKNLVSSSDPGSFRPFQSDPDKQERYNKFLSANLKADEDIKSFLATIQPLHLSEWDREMERKEFIQAQKLYKPLQGIMGDRFISEATLKTENAMKNCQQDTPEEKKQIVVERTKVMWKPESLLCKRYNIPEPFGGTMPSDGRSAPKKSKMSVFDYIDVSVNKREHFQTPNIIPKHVESRQPAPPTNDKQVAKDIPTHKDEISELKTVGDIGDVARESSEVKGASRGGVDGGGGGADAGGASISSRPTLLKKFVPKTDLERRVDVSRDQPASEKVDLFRAIFEDSDSEDEDKDKHEDDDKAKTDNSAGENVLPKVDLAAAANLLRNDSPPRGIFAALFGKTPETDTATTTATTTATATTAGISEIVQTTAQPNEKGLAVEQLKNDKNRCEDSQPTRITFKSKSERLKQQMQEEETMLPTDMLYGPQIPGNIQATHSIPSSTSNNSSPSTMLIDKQMDEKILQLLNKQKSKHKSKKHEKNNEIWVEKSNISHSVVSVKSLSSEDSSDDSDNSDSDSESESAAVQRKKAKNKQKKAKLNKKLKKKKSKKKSAKHKHEKGHRRKKEKKEK